MPHSSSLNQLQDAVKRDKADAVRRKKEYLQLLDKMKAYQQGKGPAPTSRDFTRWRTLVDEQTDQRKMQSGFSDLR